MEMGSSKLLFFFCWVLPFLATLTLAADPFFQADCVETAGNYTASSPYQASLNNIFSQLTSQTEFNYGFYNLSAGENPNKINAIALCRGDRKQSECNSCLSETISELRQRCPFSKEVIGWHEYCTLRYANRVLFGDMESSPGTCLLNLQNVSAGNEYYLRMGALLNDLGSRAAAGGPLRKYAAEKSSVGAHQTVFALVQCTPDLSEPDCRDCLTKATQGIEGCCLGKMGCRVLRPSCFLRFESSPFYQTPIPLPSPPTSPPPPPPSTGDLEGSKQGEPKWIPIVASSSAIVGLTLLCTGGVFLWRRRNIQDHNSQEVQLLELEGRVGNDYSNENFQDGQGVRSQEFPLIKLDILQAATKQFCDENKLGEGGFGPVYKGKLADGKEIAVKRLSKTSGQGLLEFKNEVMLIAKLQHRNLVRLLGCCLEQNEKLLVYEYMPNKSLDVFLFDSCISEQLDWQKRFSIIKGIARGIMYLHEDSRLKIIHRYLKASNVLLDYEMNPKISDFGMARIFGGNQSQANTNRVVGTYGYMAPEYAMEGLFSGKSDVFSFGVLLLEIISGKRNNGFHHWECGESLLTFAWKLWSKGQGMEIVGTTLVQSCVASEVLKCIHIGLLCVQEDPADRPTMSSVVVMLASETITLPQPAEPAFSVGRDVAKTAQSTSNDIVRSINEVTISNISPR